nr:uncharacterized protein LOC107279551 [Oryza sativa Japonica Group]
MGGTAPPAGEARSARVGNAGDGALSATPRPPGIGVWGMGGSKPVDWCDEEPERRRAQRRRTRPAAASVALAPPRPSLQDFAFSSSEHGYFIAAAHYSSSSADSHTYELQLKH